MSSTLGNFLIAQTHRPFQTKCAVKHLRFKMGQVQFTATFTFHTAWARDTSCRLHTDRRIELAHQVHNPAAQPHHSSSENDSRKAWRAGSSGWTLASTCFTAQSVGSVAQKKKVCKISVLFLCLDKYNSKSKNLALTRFTG